MIKKILLTLSLLIPIWLEASQTTVESSQARYDGNKIILTGNVIVTNIIGTLTAEMAVLYRDEECRSKIDFPWLELSDNVVLTLAEGGRLYCDYLYCDYLERTSHFEGNPQVMYSDALGDVYADRAQVDYEESDGVLKATKVVLTDHIKLANQETQYALADSVIYYPQEQLMILEGKESRVLFYDKNRDLTLSAQTVRAQKDKITKKESIQGVGDVRFIFGPDELEKIKSRFHLHE